MAAAREPLDTWLGVRIRASTKGRLEAAVRKLAYERQDSTVSMAGLVDEVLDAWLTEQEL